MPNHLRIIWYFNEINHINHSVKIDHLKFSPYHYHDKKPDLTLNKKTKKYKKNRKIP